LPSSLTPISAFSSGDQSLNMIFDLRLGILCKFLSRFPLPAFVFFIDSVSSSWDLFFSLIVKLYSLELIHNLSYSQLCGSSSAENADN